MSDELQAKIENYQTQIAALEARINTLDDSVASERMQIVELRSTIKDYSDRIARLERRLAGTPEPGMPTQDQLHRSDWVLSGAYDNE